MVISLSMSDSIVSVASGYLNQPFDYEKFNCVHFVRNVYYSIGIKLPLLDKTGFPPIDFHLSEEEFLMMPVGHCVFFKRKTSISDRIWTHVAIIISPNELIHCTRRFGGKVVVTPIAEFLEIYALAPKPL